MYRGGMCGGFVVKQGTEKGKPNERVNLWRNAAAAAKLLQSCPTQCDPIDSSPPGSPIPGVLQAGTREWIAISFSNAWKWKVKVKSLSCVRLLATPWAAAHQAPPSMGFSRQEYWSRVPLLSPLKAWGKCIFREAFQVSYWASGIKRVVAAKAWRQGSHLSMMRWSCLDK